MSSSSVTIHWAPVLVGFLSGFGSRLLSLRPGRTHYPGYPSGYISQFALAILASLIGSIIIAALLAKQLTAATFLTLAATQFRDVRSNERATLTHEEQLILVSRGAGYIEGIAITYEARNYLAMLVALATSIVTMYLGLIIGIIGGLVFIIIGEYLMTGTRVGDIIEVKQVPLRFEKGSLLYAGDVMMMEVGLSHSRERYETEGIGIELTPKTSRGQAALWNLSQRQAITHEAAMAVGVQKDVGYPEQTPLCRMDMPSGSGKAGLSILAVDRNPERVIKAIKSTPVLESNKWDRIISPTLKKGDATHG